MILNCAQTFSKLEQVLPQFEVSFTRGGFTMSRALLAVLAGVFLACAHGEPASADAFDDALTARREGDFPKAFRLFHILAEKGDPGAQYNLGYMYKVGEGASPDAAQAAKWIGLAANNGLAHAQYAYGSMCASGERAPIDRREAAKWFELAASQDHSAAQFRLGLAYSTGLGVPRNLVLAHMWLSLSAARGYKDAESKRGAVALLMTLPQVAEAQKLAAEWAPGAIIVSSVQHAKPLLAGNPNSTQPPHSSLPRPAQQPPTPPKTSVAETSPRNTSPKTDVSEAPPNAVTEVGAGTAFFVSDNGEALTNAHVVKKCSSILIRSAKYGAVRAWVLALDEANDLALLGMNLRPAQWASWRFSVRQGEDIVVYGFPLPGDLALSGNVVTGNITALAGRENNSTLFQISAPVQPGNSGGPLFDRTGGVVGIVRASFPVKLASNSGYIPQNINFAIKGSVAMGFLESQGYAHKETGAAQRLSTPEITAQAHAITVQVFCVR